MNDLLELIRTVDPNDREACDELNARFLCFLKNTVFIRLEDYKRDKWEYHCSGSIISECPSKCGMKYNWRFGRGAFPNYTHDLKALKAVQEAELEEFDLLIQFTVLKDKTKKAKVDIPTIYNGVVLLTPWMPEWLPTMELAWMDSIYQAIEWKRK